MGLRAGGKDVQYHFGAVEHLGIDADFEIADLGGAEFVVEDHDVGLGIAHECLEFFDLAVPQIRAGIRPLSLLCERPDDDRTSRCGQTVEFTERVVRISRLTRHNHVD